MGGEESSQPKAGIQLDAKGWNPLSISPDPRSQIPKSFGHVPGSLVRHMGKLMLCKSCGDTLEDANCYFVVVRAKTYRGTSCRPCKRAQGAILRQLRKLHPQPPLGTPCECCARVEKLQLDHQHFGARQFRGWLCKSCNVGLGLLGDRAETLDLAVAYLRQNTEKKGSLSV